MLRNKDLIKPETKPGRFEYQILEIIKSSFLSLDTFPKVHKCRMKNELHQPCI